MCQVAIENIGGDQRKVVNTGLHCTLLSQTNVPKVQLWSHCSPAFEDYCRPKEVLTLTLGSMAFLTWPIPFLVYLPPLFSISSYPERLFICSLDKPHAICPPGLCFCSSLCLPWFLLTSPHTDSISVLKRLCGMEEKGQALKSHQPKTDFRLCHLLWTSCIILRQNFLISKKRLGKIGKRIT